LKLAGSSYSAGATILAVRLIMAEKPKDNDRMCCGEFHKNPPTPYKPTGKSQKSKENQKVKRKIKNQVDMDAINEERVECLEILWPAAFDDKPA
jgi:hypothetical protein